MKTIREYVGCDIFFTLLFSLAMVLMLGLSGCATKPTAPTVEDTIKAGIVDGAVAAAKAPLFKMTCPVTGCLFGSLEVGNPGGAAQMAEIVKVAMAPQPSEASQNFRAVIGVLGQVGTIGLVSHAAASIFGKISDGYVGIASKIQAPGAITTTTNTMNATTNTSTTSTLSGTGVLGSGTYTAPITNTTNPSPKVCTPTFSATGAPTGFVCSGG